MIAAVSSRRRRVGRADRQRLAADDALEPVRRVVGDHAAVVDDRDLVGERVGLLEVLRGQQDGRAVVDEVAHDAPHVLALGGVQAGRRLVQEDDRRAADEAGGEVEAAAHAAGVGLGRAVGGVGEVEPGEQLLRAGLGLLAAEVRAARRSASRFWRPGEQLVDGRVLAGQADLLAHRGRARGRRRSRRRSRACPRRPVSSVARMRTAVVLPAPLGPSTPSTVPRRAARSTPSSACVSPKRLRRPPGFDGVVHAVEHRRARSQRPRTTLTRR